VPGRNWLGTLLMARRAELRAQVRSGVMLVHSFVKGTGQHNSDFARGDA
jgi:hypothetical protein